LFPKLEKDNNFVDFWQEVHRDEKFVRFLGAHRDDFILVSILRLGNEWVMESWWVFLWKHIEVDILWVFAREHAGHETL